MQLNVTGESLGRGVISRGDRNIRNRDNYRCLIKEPQKHHTNPSIDYQLHRYTL